MKQGVVVCLFPIRVRRECRAFESKTIINAFICEFLPALPSRTMRYSAIKLVIDAALNQPRITWQHHRLTNRVTQQLSDQSNDTQRPNLSPAPLQKCGLSCGRCLRIVSVYNIPAIIIALANHKAKTARDGRREIQ